MKKLNKKGFTLVELLAVIVVLALLMVVAASSIGSALENSRKKALLTETQKLFTNITAEAQSMKMLNELTTGATSIGQYAGEDADYTYDVTINDHGYITSLTVCYGSDYSVSLTTESGITVSNTFVTTMDSGITVDAKVATCEGKVTVE